MSWSKPSPPPMSPGVPPVSRLAVRLALFFENDVMRRRPEVRKGWCVRVLLDPVRREHQKDNRKRHSAAIDEMGGMRLRVVTLDDGVTILNAFFDRRLKR